jgi:hypothetical protein
LGFPTFFVKVRAHTGEPYNEASDRIASTAARDDDVPLLWNAPSGRIIYQFTPDESNSEDGLYSASMNDTVKKFIKNQAAMSSLYSLPHMGLRNRSCDALIAAGICLARVWWTGRFQMKLRNASFNLWAYNFPVVPSFTNGAKRIPITVPSATKGNLWCTFKVAVS